MKHRYGFQLSSPSASARLAAVLGLASLAGLVAPSARASTLFADVTLNIVLEAPPPPPHREVIVGISPGPDYIWIGGYWDGEPGHYRWVGGRWGVRPIRTANGSLRIGTRTATAIITRPRVSGAMAPRTTPRTTTRMTTRMTTGMDRNTDPSFQCPDVFMQANLPPRPMASASDPETFWSSRWSVGNHVFRDSVGLAPDGILFRKRRLFGSSEEHINYRAVSSIRIRNGIFLSNVSIETSGGSQPILINGLWKSDAKRVQDVIRAHGLTADSPGGPTAPVG